MPSFDELPSLETARDMPPLSDTGEEQSGTEQIRKAVQDQPLVAPQEEPFQSPEAETQPKPEAPGPIDPKIQGLIDKYEGDIFEVAKAALSAQQKMTESSQRKAELERQLGDLQGQTRMPPPVVPQAAPVNMPALNQEEMARLNDDFWSNPAQAISRILDVRETQKEIVNAQQDFNSFITQNQPDLMKHQNKMAELYMADKDYYDRTPPNIAVRKLLNNAKKEEAFQAASSFISQLQNYGYNFGSASPGQANTSAGQNPVVNVGTGTPASVVGPQNLREKELLRRVKETQGEDGWALADLLKARGVASHIT